MPTRRRRPTTSRPPDSPQPAPEEAEEQPGLTFTERNSDSELVRDVIKYNDVPYRIAVRRRTVGAMLGMIILLLLVVVVTALAVMIVR